MLPTHSPIPVEKPTICSVCMSAISIFAGALINKNWYNDNKNLADKAVTSAKDVTDNKFILGHNLMSRMTVTALGKDVKLNNSGVKTVSLLFTFSTQADKESCGVSARSSLPKGYKESYNIHQDFQMSPCSHKARTHILYYMIHNFILSCG